MAGVQYDINISGGGVDILSQILGLFQQNTSAVQQLTGVMSSFGGAVTSAMSNIAGTTGTLNQTAAAASSFSGSVSEAINQASESADQFSESGNNLNNSIGQLSQPFNVTVTAVGKLDNGVSKLGRSFSGVLKPAVDKLPSSLTLVTTETNRFDQSVGKLSNNITGELKSSLDQLLPEFSSMVSALGRLEGVVENLTNTIGKELKPSMDDLKKSFDGAQKESDELGGSFEKLGKAAFYLNNIRSALQGVTDDLNRAVQPGINLDTQLHQMQAVTQLSDEQMKKLSQSARDNAKAFGIEASSAVSGYQTFVAGLGPTIAQVPEAMNTMGKNAAVLSKQMGGDMDAAAGVLTTAVQQFGVSLDDPIKAADTMTVMMNIMSAAAREGSAELPDLKAGLEQSGLMAKTANVSFAESNAALEILSNNGKKASEGGVALRNVMSILSEGEFLPKTTLEMLQAAGIDVNGLGDKSKTLAERLSLLAPIANDTAAMTQLFGRENVAAGIALVNNSAAITDMTGKINGTNAAYEQADIIMNSYEEKQNRITAAIKDFGISIFNATQEYLPFINMGMGSLQVLSNLAGAVQLFGMISQSSMIRSIGSAIVSMGTWIGTTLTATAAQMGLNIALSANPIGLVVIAVAAAVGAIALLINYWDEIWAAIKSFTAWMFENSPFGFLIKVVEEIFPGFKSAMGALWDWVAGKFEALIAWFKKAWDWIKSLFGAGKDAGSDAGKSAVEGFNSSLKNAKIEGITVQAAAKTDSPLDKFKPHDKGGNGKGKGAGDAGKSISKGATSGGNRPTVINITIQKLQDQLIVNAGNLRDAAKKAGTDVVNELVMALNSVDQKGGVAYE